MRDNDMSLSLCRQLQVDNTFSMIGESRSNAFYAIERQNDDAALAATDSHQPQPTLIVRILKRSCALPCTETILGYLGVELYVWQLEESNKSWSLV